MSGRSSGVEHNLAKVGVGRSNRLARSIIFTMFDTVTPILGAAFARVGHRLNSAGVEGALADGGQV